MAIAADQAAQAKREARRAASRDAKARAQAELNEALTAPLVPTSPKHDLERIRAMRPKFTSEHEAQVKP
jgi:uncharacterized protein YggE